MTLCGERADSANLRLRKLQQKLTFEREKAFSRVVFEVANAPET